MEKKRLEQEYRKLKQQEAPELWTRIEEKLKDHPDGEQAGITRFPDEHKKRERRWRSGYGAAAAIAVVAILGVAGDQGLTGRQKAMTMTEAGAPEMYAAVEEEAAAPAMDAAVEEEAAAPEMYAADGDMVPETAASGQDGSIEGAVETAASGLDGTMGEAAPETAASSAMDEGAAKLLCAGTVLEAKLEYDGFGQAAGIAYRIRLEQVYEKDDREMAGEELIVRTSIEPPEGTSSFYELRLGGVYLLALKREGADWRLLCPFAPRIALTEGGQYRFCAEAASLAIKEQPEK